MARPKVASGARNAVAMQQSPRKTAVLLGRLALENAKTYIDDVCTGCALVVAALDTVEQQPRRLATDRVAVNLHRGESWMGVGSEAQIAEPHDSEFIRDLDAA